MLPESPNDFAVVVSGMEEVLNVAVQANHNQGQLEHFCVGGVYVDGK